MPYGYDPNMSHFKFDEGQLEKLSNYDSNSDDEEINQLILNEDEKKLKTILWNNLNKEWLEEQAAKKKKKRE